MSSNAPAVKVTPIGSIIMEDWARLIAAKVITREEMQSALDKGYIEKWQFDVLFPS